MNSPAIGAVLLYANGNVESLPITSKTDFAHRLMDCVTVLF
jgi:hypothetical protein